jgi:hypothetical protein
MSLNSEVSFSSYTFHNQRSYYTYFETKGPVIPCMVKASSGAGIEPDRPSWSTPSARAHKPVGFQGACKLAQTFQKARVKA